MSDQPAAVLAIDLDRAGPAPLSEQICGGLRAAILDGRIAGGSRLPSIRDLAVQLGVARGTVQAAYERLADEQLVLPAGAAGTRVARARAAAAASAPIEIRRPMGGIEYRFSTPPLPFQMGAPAQDAFPAKLWARIRSRALRDDAMAPTSYPDPRGQPALRARIAGHLAIARGIRCTPDQIIVTGGFRSGLAMAVRALGLDGRPAWMEEPGFPVTRRGLQLAGLHPVPVPVDGQGIDVGRGIALAPDAALAVVTPGQQAPTGVTLSPDRRRALLRWAAEAGSWIVEDDFLSELQLEGRAAPALAAEDPEGRVIHIGSFSKTLSPALGLGFLVAPLALAERFGEIVTCLAPAPSPTAQAAVATFLAEGHYLRHLRHMKRLYAARRDALRACLGAMAGQGTTSGLALLLRLPPGSDDVAIARLAFDRGLAPMALSPWFADPAARWPGLLLSVTNLRDGQPETAWARLRPLIDGGAHTSCVHRPSP